jgi:hypothetical protein
MKKNWKGRRRKRTWSRKNRSRRGRIGEEEED